MQVTTVDYAVAFRQLQTMFPLDANVIHAVLKVNRGDLDASVNDLLAMCMTEEEESTSRSQQQQRAQAESRKRAEAARSGSCRTASSHPLFPSHGYSVQETELPPSYEQAVSTVISHPAHQQHRCMIPCCPHSERFHHFHHIAHDYGRRTPSLEDPTVFSISTTASSLRSSHQLNHRVVFWNPPHLGDLPADFLRLPMDLVVRQRTARQPHASGNGPVPTFCGNVQCQKCGKFAPSSSAQSSTSVVSDSWSTLSGRPTGEGMDAGGAQHRQPSPRHLASVLEVGQMLQQRLAVNTRNLMEEQRRVSLPVEAEHAPPHADLTVSHHIQSHPSNMGLNRATPLRASMPHSHHRRNHHHNSRHQPRSHSPSADLTSMENSQQRFQELNDERMAIMLQNEEFLLMLRADRDFMHALQIDQEISQRQRRAANPSLFPRDAASGGLGDPLAGLDEDHTDKHAPEGYGEELNSQLNVIPDAFPYTVHVPGMPNSRQPDTNDDLRRQLRNMGKFSKKKFSALARRFASLRNRRRPLYTTFSNEDHTLSTLELLDEGWSTVADPEGDTVSDANRVPYSELERSTRQH